MIEKFKTARIVITHGGPSTFMMAIQEGKRPIVVPRLKKFDEHVNDHQRDFAKKVEAKQKNIIVVENINELKEQINIVDKNNSTLMKENSNNYLFNQKLSSLIFKLMGDKK